MEACFSAPSIALLGVVATAIQATIVTLFWLLLKAKDAQIQREQDLNDRTFEVALTGTRGTEQAVGALREKRVKR